MCALHMFHGFSCASMYGNICRFVYFFWPGHLLLLSSLLLLLLYIKQACAGATIGILGLAFFYTFAERRRNCVVL